MIDKIREAFEKYFALNDGGTYWHTFEAGYLAGRQSLLDELEQVGYAYCYQGQDICFSTEPQSPEIPVTYYWQEPIYRLPEGITK